MYRILGACIVIAGYFSYDYFYNKKSQKDAEREHVKYLL